MKTQTKALIASLIVVALGLSAVSGVTYSWWSDSENAQVTVTTGQIEIDVGLDQPTVHGDGSSSKISMAEDDSGTSSDKFAVTGWVAAPGDVMTIPISYVKITSNIRTQYTESYSIASSAENLSAYVSITPSAKVGNIFESSDGNADIFGPSDKRTIEIEVLSTLPATLMGKVFTVTLEFAVYQASATDIPSGAAGTTSSSIAVVDGAEIHAGVINRDSPASAASVSFKGSLSNEGTYNVNSVTPSDVSSDSYTIFEGEILGGISVKHESDDTMKLAGTLVKVEFVVDRVIQEENIAIYHNSDPFHVDWKTDLTQADGNGEGYLSNDGTKTMVTFYTTAGFSMYYAVDASLINISTPNQLFEFADKVNVEKETYGEKTIRLISDIDLAGKSWTPVGQTGSVCFTGDFDGNGKTIRNMTINTPVGTAPAYATGFFGWFDGGTISNLTIDNADVRGNHYVGAIVGYEQFGSIKNCTVSNSTIINTCGVGNETGDKTGAIVGYVGPNAGEIIGNIIENVTVSGCRDVGGIAGLVSTGKIFKSNEIRGENTISVIPFDGYGENHVCNIRDFVGRDYTVLSVNEWIQAFV